MTGIEQLKLMVKTLMEGNQPLERISALAIRSASAQASHHLRWYLDQIFREAMGQEAYAEFVAAYESWTGLEWETGTAP